MKNILKFVFGSFLIFSATPIAIALHHFAISTFPFLTSDGYGFATYASCLIYACYQNFIGFMIVGGSCKKIFD